MSYDKDNWAVPTGLSRKARKLALALAKLAKERNWNAGQKVSGPQSNGEIRVNPMAEIRHWSFFMRVEIMHHSFH